MPLVAGIQDLVRRIRESEKRARGSELKLQGECDGHLRSALKTFDIEYDPEVNKSLGRSFASSGRPDSLFGRVVLDYKAPGVLRTGSGLTKAKKQVVDDYLTPISTIGGTFDRDEAGKLVGVLLDGRAIAFVTFDGEEWVWTPVRPVDEYTLSTLIQYYRALHRKPLDPHLLSADFGRDTEVGVSCIRAFANYLAHPTTRTTMFFREWKRMFAQVSGYDLGQLPALAKWAKSSGLPCEEDPALLLYCLHTYYALIVKLLTAELVTANRHLGFDSFLEKLAHAPDSTAFRREIERLEMGEVYRDLGILNFLEGDFFLWYLPHYDPALETGLRKVVEVFQGYEPATPKLNPNRSKDLLKAFYTGVIDQEIRHDLGEYYTPDWLAELVLDRIGYEGRLDAKLLDPACGSGTFLVLAIQRFAREAARANLTAREIIDRACQQFRGFDLNPLAVISARANYLLAIAEYLAEAQPGSLEIPIYLCDSINIPLPKEVAGVPCLIYKLETELGPRDIALPKSLIDAGIVGRVLLQAEQAIRDHASSQGFVNALRRNSDFKPHITASVISLLKTFYETIDDLENKDWDEIWCRIVKNHFASHAVADIDYVVGNPPWVRWSRLPASYRDRCKSFCNYYGLVSGRGYTGGIESDISTVVTYSAIDNWLRPGCLLAFLITATVYKSDSARGFRLFKLPAPDETPIFPLTIDDLVALRPFPDAENETSLIVLRKGRRRDRDRDVYPQDGIPYTVWQGAKPSVWLSLDKVAEITKRTTLRATPIADRGSPLYIGSPADVKAIQPFKGQSRYMERSHKGTTTDLARVYWVKVLAYDKAQDLAKIRTLTEEELAIARVEGIATTTGKWVEASLLYPLIRGRDIGRFSYATEGWYILVPNRRYNELEPEVDFGSRYPRAYEYLRRNRDLLERRATYKRYQHHLPFYAIYDVGPYTFSPFKVASRRSCQDRLPFLASPSQTSRTALYSAARFRRGGVRADRTRQHATWQSRQARRAVAGPRHSRGHGRSLRASLAYSGSRVQYESMNP